VKTFIIAEAGSNHEGVLGNAMKLIDVAKEAGADAVKFQYWSSPERMSQRRNAPDKPFYKYAMPERWLKIIHTYCNAKEIEFMCTVYLPEDIETVAPFVKRFKISSFEAMDEEFTMAHVKYEKPLIISTGMITDDEMEDLPYTGIVTTYLQCTSAYPAPISEANLLHLFSPDNPNTYCDGFSDHTKSLISGAVAVGLGADIIEKHFKLESTSPEAPDFEVSLYPGQLRAYIKNVREAELLLGDGEKKIQPSEQENVRFRVK